MAYKSRAEKNAYRTGLLNGLRRKRRAARTKKNVKKEKKYDTKRRRLSKDELRIRHNKLMSDDDYVLIFRNERHQGYGRQRSDEEIWKDSYERYVNHKKAVKAYLEEKKEK